ncbi:MAG TPA: MgtC/SapB family protein [Burkholderiales bacterium]|nr:MgtC/SapB family protein [Burkholderiales bacterium]
MDRENFVILEHLLIALCAGGLIGFERSYHGRPAGFRTHTLVCVASSALMLVTVYQGQWFPVNYVGSVNLDPTRMAQGIMTGIGFLGAGVIFKEGLTVRGLTTAASIWITAAIGILAGIGFYFPMIVTTLLTLGTLSVFRWIEAKVPGEFFAHLQVRCRREGGMGEDELRRFLLEYGFSVANMNYTGSAEPRCIEYQMVIKAREEKRARVLAEALGKSAQILDFRMTPTGD